MILFPRQCINICIRTPSLPRYKSTCQICVTAIHMGLKTSNDLYTCLWRKTCQMRTLELHYCKERGTCIGCLRMLIPKYAVSSRDECVVLAVMTVKESSTQLYWVGVCVHAIMCVAVAARLCISVLRYFPRCDLDLLHTSRFMCIIFHHILKLCILKYII